MTVNIEVTLEDVRIYLMAMDQLPHGQVRAAVDRLRVAVAKAAAPPEKPQDKPEDQ